jgi:hypothetical protein
MEWTPGVNFTDTFGAKTEQLLLGDFNDNSILQKCNKMCRYLQKLLPKMCSKISAEILAKHNSSICFMLAPFCIAQMERNQP